MYKPLMLLCTIIAVAIPVSALPSFPSLPSIPFRKKSKKPTTQTAANTNFLVFPQDIGRYINEIRLRPSILIPLIQQKLSTFVDNKKMMVGSTSHQTFEGKAAWQEALQFVQGLKPMGPLNFSVVLQRAAIDHAIDMAVHNAISHVGSKGQSVYQRVNKYTNFNFGAISQTLITEFEDQTRDHALQTLLSLIVNDGLPTRAYRKTLFNPAMRFYGQASRMGNHKAVVVILFSTNTYQLTLKAVARKRNQQPVGERVITKGPTFVGTPLLSNTPKTNVPVAAIKSVVQARVNSQIIGGSEKRAIQRVFADGSQQIQTQIINLSI